MAVHFTETAMNKLLFRPDTVHPLTKQALDIDHFVRRMILNYTYTAEKEHWKKN
jgi:hypothetical protein